jgi:hypothetical protein
MNTTTSVEVTTRSVHDLAAATERTANALPEPDRKSVFETAKSIRQRRSSLLPMLDQERRSQTDE